MKVFFDPDQLQHAGQGELSRGRLIPCYENPERSRSILRALEQGKLDSEPPPPLDPGFLASVHSPDYLEFLASAHEDWLATGHEGDALPFAFRPPGDSRVPTAIAGRLAEYAFAVDSPITAHTWRAALASAACAVAGAKELRGSGSEAALALSRPPGHHASTRNYGGYCYLNNAALAAEQLLQDGCRRVAILDVDEHHGNGTQEIFYRRPDVLTVSLHADPEYAFPYFIGFAEECGEAEGHGFNRNVPLPRRSTWTGGYEAALVDALTQTVVPFEPDALVVALGLDAYAADPLAYLALETEDFRALGSTLASRCPFPTLFVLEGGYHVEDLGRNLMAVLDGWRAGR